MKGSISRALVLACFSALILAGAVLAANSGSFSDPAGDARNAPDVTGVAVANDDAGIVTIRVTVGNRSVLAANDYIAVGIDADQNPDTGAMFYGGEYQLELDGNVPGVLRPGSDGYYEDAPAPVSFSASFSGGVATFSFKASDLGVSSGFNVYALGFNGQVVDTAPDLRTVSYQLVAGTTGPTPPADRRPPVDEALRSRGVHGKQARLSYYAADGRGETADSIVVYRGRKVLARINYGLQDTNPFVSYFARWNVPRKVRGNLRFCVTSTDRAGNKSRQSCAALKIT
jgi:hypothetical protein